MNTVLRRDMVEARFKKAIDLLRSLIQIESTSGNERLIANFIEDYINKFRDNNKISMTRHGNNIVAKYKNGNSQNKFALAAHIDTVPYDKDKWTQNPLGGDIFNNRIFGRGSADVKCGVAILLAILEQCKTLVSKFDITFAFFDKEEKGIPNGITHLISSGVFDDVSAVLVIEPTENQLVCGCMGNIAVSVEIGGREAHSCRPDFANSAIDNFVLLHNHLSENFKKDYKEYFGQKVFEQISFTQLNTNSAVNQIPGSCVAGIDYRYLPQKSNSKALRILKSNIKGSGILINKITPLCNDPACIYEDLPTVLAEFQRENSLQSRFSMFWSDIAQFSSRGIPSANFGPGSIDQAHAVDEYIEIDQLKMSFIKLNNLVFDAYIN